MRFQNIEMVGKFILQKVENLPVFNDNTDKGRLIYNKSNDLIYYGSETQWILIGTLNDLLNHEQKVLDVTDTNTDKEKHLSNAQGKKWEDHVDNDDIHVNLTDKTGWDAHVDNNLDPHNTLNEYNGPGYIIYFTSNPQSRVGWYPIIYDSISDSYNVNDRVVANSGLNTFTLQRGYYKISYIVVASERGEGSTPPINVEMYNVTLGTGLVYTRSSVELDTSSQNMSLSFSFPIFIPNQTQLQLRHTTSDTQKGWITRSTLVFEIPMSVKNY